MRRTLLALALVPAALTSVAQAACFTVVDRANRIVYRSEISPIDLSVPIHQSLPKVFPNAQLLISDETRICTFIDPASPIDPLTGAAASPDSGGTVSVVSGPATKMAAAGAGTVDASPGIDEGCRRGGTVTRRGEPCPETAVVGQRVVGAEAAPAAPAAAERPVERGAVRRAR